MGRVRADVAVCMALALLTVVGYLPVARHDFVNFDDPDYVTENPIVQAGLTRAGVAWAFTARHSFNWHPITWLSHMLDCQLLGLEAAGHHLANLAWHVVNTCLLFLVLHRMTEAPPRKATIWQCAFVAALFAVHPLHVESVAWVSERKDLLSTFFWLATMWFYWRYTRRPASRVRYALVLVSLVLGLMAKPMLVTLPFVLLLLDYWPLGRWHPAGWVAGAKASGRAPATRMVIEKLPMFGLAVLSSAITYWAQQTGGAVQTLEARPFAGRCANAIISYAVYIGQSIRPTRLACFYPYWVNDPDSRGRVIGWLAASCVLLVTVSVVAVRESTRRPYLLVGWLWYVGTLVPVIGLVQVGDQAHADRYTYVPLIGLFIMAAWGVPELLPRRRWNAVALWAIGAAVVACSLAITWRQVGYWRDGVTLFSRAVAVTERNYHAEANLGSALLAVGDLEGAKKHSAAAVVLNPDFHVARLNLATVLSQQGDLAGAAENARAALANNPSLAEAQAVLAEVARRQGRPREARERLEQALKMKPRLGDRADVQFALGDVAAELGEHDAAIAYYEQALRIAPQTISAAAFQRIGSVRFRQNRIDESMVAFRRAVAIDRSDPQGHALLGDALVAAGQIRDALASYREALHHDPHLLVVANNLAWILATNQDPAIRNGAEAVMIAERSVRASSEPGYEQLDTLAAALAAAGRFEEAAATAQTALETAVANGKNSDAQQIRSRLARYRDRMPYYE